MNLLITIANFSFNFSALSVVIVALMHAWISRDIDKQVRRYLLNLFSIVLLYVASDLCAQISQQFTDEIPVTRVSVFLESLSSSVILLILSVNLLRSTSNGEKESVLVHITAGLWLVFFVLLVLTQFMPLFYSISPQNEYVRGPLYPILPLPMILLAAIDFFLLLRRQDRLSRRQFNAFLAFFLLPLGAMSLQLLISGLHLIVLTAAVASIFFFMCIVREQTERAMQQKEENIRQRASIAVLQMRPHFIYNTMTSIYYLCGQDPEQAQQVILDFTSYLRKNFTAIAREETISFSEELEHTRAYLAVEQVRFAGSLFVTFDTPHTRFRLPPLTLQPVVENAVKHGLDPELAPLHILVRTAAAEGGSEILVEDSGPGYEPSDDDQPHIALANIRERLEIMCGGSLAIESGEQGGTTVRIFIPDRKKSK